MMESDSLQPKRRWTHLFNICCPSRFFLISSIRFIALTESECVMVLNERQVFLTTSMFTRLAIKYTNNGSMYLVQMFLHKLKIIKFSA